SADGGERWFRTEVHAVDEAGQRRLLGLMIDVTEARRTAAALSAAEARLRQVINNAPIVLFALDQKGRFTLAEGSGLRALGLKPGEPAGHNVFEGYRREPVIVEHVRRALAGEAFTAYDEVQESGSWWETRWSPLFDEAGRPNGATAVALNITERRRAEQMSAQSLSLLRATIEATTDGVLVVDNGGRIVDYNRRFAEM